MVRALAHVLPERVAWSRAAASAAIRPTRTRPARTAARHDGSTTRPARLVELPVGATEDRVIGALDLQQALGSRHR